MIEPLEYSCDTNDRVLCDKLNEVIFALNLKERRKTVHPKRAVQHTQDKMQQCLDCRKSDSNHHCNGGFKRGSIVCKLHFAPA